MKAFAIIPVFALFCGISAAPPNKKDVDFAWGTLSTMLPIPLNKGHPTFNITFGDLAKYYESKGRDPLDTFIFYLATSPKDRKNQNLDIDVTKLRKAIPDLPLSISGCDGLGITCSPASSTSMAARKFQAIEKSENSVSLNTDFADHGGTFFVYLQIPNTPGKDNAARPLSGATHSALYNQVVNYNKPDEVAIIFTIKGVIAY